MVCTMRGFRAGIFLATSASRPRADVAYCIHALARRIAKTHNWTVNDCFYEAKTFLILIEFAYVDLP